MKIESYKTKSGTRYRFQIRLGEKVTTRSGYKTRNEAIYAYTKALDEYNQEQKGNILYQKAYEQWLQIYKTKVKESTYESCTSIYEIHILPVFGQTKIQDIKVQDCQEFALSLKDYVKGKEYYGYAKRIVDYAIKMNYTKNNPFNNVILPKFKKGKKQINYLTTEEVSTLLEYFKNNQYRYTLFRLMIYTGLRRGETLALTWKDINFENKTLSVNKTLSIGNYKKTVLLTPKTETSKRTIDLDDKTILELKKLKIQSKHNLIFPNRRGQYARLSSIADKLNQATKETSIKKIRVHDLRHTHASLLFASGANIKYVQERLGHNNIQTTMNVYTHVTKDTKEKDLKNFIKYMEIEA